MENILSALAEVEGIPRTCLAIKARCGHLDELCFHQFSNDEFLDMCFSAKNDKTSSKGSVGFGVCSYTSPNKISIAVLDFLADGEVSSMEI